MYMQCQPSPVCSSLQENQLIKCLLELDQEHLFSNWPHPGAGNAKKVPLVVNPSSVLCNMPVMCCTGQGDDNKQKLVQQLAHLDASYNGGLEAYIKNAKQLLQDSREGKQ